MNPEKRISPGESTRLRVQLAHVALLTIPLEEMKYPAQDNFRYFDVIHENPDGPIIGELSLQYLPVDRVKIHNVKLEPSQRRRKLGIEIYRSIPFIPAPNGEIPPEHGWLFGSDPSDSSDGKLVWQGLEKRGFAEKIGEVKYEMRDDVARPDFMTIQEF